ncbi:hypothetical protein [Rhodococcus kronopolitis]|uniref:Uncharacterized protein n=1 Tax=Rhodococcus kronopolitis TaxID=1460226 RepID=A0ABV9FN22_9NOCA
MEDSTSSSEVAKWVSMADWLIESLTDKPVAFILEMGPNSYIDYGSAIDDDEDEDEESVVCVQIHVLANDVFMLRRSRTMLRRLMIADYSTDRLALDRWHNDDHFEDCTDGYLFTRDARLVADTSVAWFRDNWGTRSTDDLGCEYHFPDELLAPEPDE